jgi:hypothetical protein
MKRQKVCDKEEEEQEMCPLSKWREWDDLQIFNSVIGNPTKRFRWRLRSNWIYNPWGILCTNGYVTALSFAICANRGWLTRKLLKSGVSVDAPCVWNGCFSYRPIELIRFPNASALYVLKHEPDFAFRLPGPERAFCEGNHEEPVASYIYGKRMRALCFCLREMGESWPDIAWIIKDFLL